MRSLNSRWQSVLVLIMVSPLLTSVVVRTLAWVVLLSRRGIFNQVLGALGLARDAASCTTRPRSWWR